MNQPDNFPFAEVAALARASNKTKRNRNWKDGACAHGRRNEK